MSWLRKFITLMVLSQPEASLIKASGGEPRTVRGITLDPRFQFIEAQARKRPVNWVTMTPAQMRAQEQEFSNIGGGRLAPGVRTEKVYITGRSHSVPALLFLPDVRNNASAMLVYYHWGGGVVGTPQSPRRMLSLIAKEAGAPVLSVDYRLAPEHKFPAGLEDATAAYLWALDNAARYGAPARKAAVGGDSQGGNFAAVIAQDMRGPRAPVLQILIYPAVDYVSETPSMHDFADAFPLTAQTVDFFIRSYLPEGADPSDPRLSPGRVQNLSGLAPALIYTAGFDMLADQGEAYAQRLREAGVPTAFACFESMPHGWVEYPALSPVAEAAIRRVARETAAALKGQMPA